jgi:glycosyltransferase involved in cell wall biosynthesis
MRPHQAASGDLDLARSGTWVVIPCHRVRAHILEVLQGIPSWVEGVVCVDDACPDRSGDLIEAEQHDPRVTVLRLEVNQGVGGATMAGYREAIDRGANLLVKVDGDGQMDLRYLPAMVAPILLGRADYTKGNRFSSATQLRGMPAHRVFGNAVLSLLAKASTGYWKTLDPTNGFTAIHAAVATRLLERSPRSRYLFETDVLYHLGVLRAVVRDVPMPARYGDEVSGLRPGRVMLPLLWLHLRNFVARVLGRYFVRDISAASIELVAGFAGCAFAVGYTIWWRAAHAHGHAASAGVVMAAAVPAVLGVQLLLQAIHFDVTDVPTEPIGPDLQLLDEVA